MDKTARWYRYLDRVLEHPIVFNLCNAALSPGKGRHIKRFLADVPFSSVIDIGCGTGHWCKLAPGPYLGVDTSASFIRACHRRYRDEPLRRFVHSDVADINLQESYDLAMLISTLHHLSDDELSRLLPWVNRHASYFFVLDLCPVSWNPISRWLYSIDRGDHIREPSSQKKLLSKEPGLQLVKEDTKFDFAGLYRYTLFLFETDQFSRHYS